MAKLNGALLSLGGSGSIADALTFSKWKGRPYVRQKVTPANPNSTGQQLTRNIFKNASLLYKNAPSLVRDPWDLYIKGQVMTSYNAFSKFFVGELRGDSDLADMVFSPGAKGGVAPVSITVTPGSNQLSVAVTVPSPPTGWTLTSVTAACILDGAPESLTAYDWTADEDTSDPYTVVLTGLTASVQYAVGAWIKWEKPDGSVAYGPSLTDLATPTA